MNNVWSPIIAWQETREWEDPPGDAIAVYDKEANDQRTQMRGEKPNIDYYELLEVCAPLQQWDLQQVVACIVRPCSISALMMKLDPHNNGVLPCYAIPQVTRDADVTTIKKQYYLLARKYHPDKNKDSPEATEKFQQLGEAYQVGSDALRCNKGCFDIDCKSVCIMVLMAAMEWHGVESPACAIWSHHSSFVYTS